MEKRHFLIITSSLSEKAGTGDIAFNDYSRLLTVVLLDLDIELTSKLQNNYF